MQVDEELMNIIDIINGSKGPYLLKGICKTKCHSALYVSKKIQYFDTSYENKKQENAYV